MRAVWKFPILVPDCTLSMPHGAAVVHVGKQRGAVTLWAVVDPQATPQKRRFRIFGTGEAALPFTARHVHTWLEEDDRLVWHLFEIPVVSK